MKFGFDSVLQFAQVRGVSEQQETLPGSRYTLEGERSPFTWKGYLRSTGTLGKRWLRRRVRQDWMVHEIAPGVDIITFWLDERIGGGGTGVCVSLFCHGYEILRFDCFGPDGHFHIAPFTPWGIFGVKERRLLFKVDTPEEQVERCLFEIQENLDFYLQLNPKRCVRATRVDHDARVRACESARQRLHDHLQNVPLLRER